MTFACALIAAALSRAEIIERFRVAPLTKVSGLVQVVADCPADLRREFLSPVATFAADICTRLNTARRVQPVRFVEPGISIYLGDGRTNDTRVIVTEGRRASGALQTRIVLPAPATTDLEELRLAIVRAYYRAVLGESIDREQAVRAIRDADPALKADYYYEQIERWLRGEPVDFDDEEMLKLYRGVLTPGAARVSDILRFASRLHLYPEAYDRPFCGRYPNCTFAEAIDLKEQDPRLRLVAFLKAREIVTFGGGRSLELNVAVEAYSKFLIDLARGGKTKNELLNQLEEADAKLNIALEEARKREEGHQQ